MRQRRIGLRGAALVIVAALGLGVGAGILIHSQQAGHASSARDNPPGLHGQATWEPGERPAPDFQLADQSGRPVSLASLRGSPVMLAFLSSRCRLACAREARYLGSALRLVPATARPALVVVSVDPLHDTPESTRAAAARWGFGAAAGWHWLLGSTGSAGQGVEVVRGGGPARGCFRDRKEPRVPDRQKWLRARRSPLSLPADVAGRRSAHPGPGGMTGALTSR